MGSRFTSPPSLQEAHNNATSSVVLHFVSCWWHPRRGLDLAYDSAVTWFWFEFGVIHFSPFSGLILILHLLHELFYPPFNDYIHIPTFIRARKSSLSRSPLKISALPTMDPETPEKTSGAWTDEAKVCSTLHFDAYWVSMLA